MCACRWCRTLIDIGAMHRRLSALLLVALVPGALAAEPDDREYEEPAPWTEEVKTLPELSQEADLIALDVDGPQRNFKHYIDAKSVALYGDGVTTYAAVIVSDSGAKNIFLEGIRCDTGQYKTYAFGSSDGTYQKSQTATWQRVLRRSGPTNYRSDLLRYYLCDASGHPLKAKQIIERLKHPQLIPSRNSSQ